MSYAENLPEEYKLVRIYNATAANSAAITDYLCCKNAHKVWFLISNYGNTGSNPVISLKEATTVAGGSAAAVTATFPIWVDVDHGIASDTLVKQTDAASYTLDLSATSQAGFIVFEWDPAKHTSGFDCIAVEWTNGNGSNNMHVLAVIAERYPQATPPSAIID